MHPVDPWVASPEFAAHMKGVLSVGKLAAGQEEYYLATVADGVSCRASSLTRCRA